MSSTRAAVLVAKTAVGATIVVLPSLAARLGAPLAAAVVGVVAVASWLACVCVLEAQREAGTPSYAEALGVAIHPRARVAATTVLGASIAAFGIGMQAVYTVAIADLLWTRRAGRRAFMVASTVFVLAPLSAPRSVAASSTAAAVGMFSTVAWLAVTAGLLVVAATHGRAHPLPLTPASPLAGDDILHALALTLNGFVVQQATGAIVRDCDAGATAVGVGLAATAALYVLVPTACVSLFGAGVISPDVLTNYTPSSLTRIIGPHHPRTAEALAAACRVAVAICLATSYPLQHWAARDAALTLAAEARRAWRRVRAARADDGDEQHPSIDVPADDDDASPSLSATDAASWRVLLGSTGGLCAVSLAAALTARDVAAAVASVGGTAGSAIALILPAAVAAAAGRWRAAVSLAGLGVAACVGVFVGQD